MTWRGCLVLCLAGLLSACALLTGIDGDTAVVTDRSQALGPALESFSLAGRLMLQQGQRRDHLRFEWDHTRDADQLLLTTPLGQGVARLARDATGAGLDLADGRRFTAGDWQSLTQQVFGQVLPLDELPHWLRGARPEWQGEVGGWQVNVSEANARIVAGPHSEGAVQTPRRQRRLLPRVMEASVGDTLLRLIVDATTDGDE